MVQAFYSGTKFFFFFIIVLLASTEIYAQSAIPFELSPQGHIMVKAKVNGVEGNFIFDTGAGLTLVTKNFSKKLGKLHQQDGSYTAFRATGEKLTADLYDVQTVSLGSFVEPNPIVTIFDVNLGPIDGLISLMTFRKQPFTIDYTNKQIIFESYASMSAIRKSGQHIPLQLDDARGKALSVFAYFKVNEKLNLQFSIDSGAGDGVYRINSAYLDALEIDTVNADKKVIPSEFNPAVKTTIYQANVKSLRATAAPSVECHDIKASFIQGLIYDGIITLSWIGKKVTFDLIKREMIVR